MAERRMIARYIVDSDAFLDMPQSAQNLYFHLNVRADDDGFIDNPRKIMRIIGSSNDDLKVLLSKRYLLGFETGVIVIKHWKLHNYIRKDRYTPTVYQEEKNSISEKENGSYTDRQPSVDKRLTDGQPVVDKWSTNGQPTVNQASTSGRQVVTEESKACPVGEGRLGKVSIGKTRGKDSTLSAPQPPAVSDKNDIEQSDKKQLSPMKNDTANLYQQMFTQIFPHEAWSDYAKERKQLSTLGNKTEKLLQTVPQYDTEKDLAIDLFNTFLAMKKNGDKFEQKQPVVPSAMSNMWSRIIDQLARGQPDDDDGGISIEDLAEVF